MADKSANKQKTDKKRKPPRSAWKPGQSGNPSGRPPDGESWAGVFKELANKTAEELADMFGDNDLGRTYKRFPKGVQMKYLVGGRVLAALMFEPSGSMLNVYMDRMEGKVPDKIQHEGTLRVDGLKETLAKVYGNRSTDT